MEMPEIRDALIAATDRHEAECPGDGRPCIRQRCNAVAFLAHALGIRGPNMWAEVLTMTREYDRQCVGRDCRHEAN